MCRRIVHSKTIQISVFRLPENKNTKLRSDTFKIYSPGYWATIADSAMRVKSVRTHFEDQISLYTVRSKPMIVTRKLAGQYASLKG